MHKVQLAKMLLLLSFLLLLTPFISTSLRSPYLYFLFNLLIIVLGADAGLLSAISKPVDFDNKKPIIITTATPLVTNKKSMVEAAREPTTGKPKRIAETKTHQSKPSIFFIGGFDEELVEEEDNEKQISVAAKAADGDMISKQELFMKAEAFIGNFYNQLKMQREESWKKIHGLYHRAF